MHLFIILIFDLLAFTCILPLFPTLMDFYAKKSELGDFYSLVVDQLKKFQLLIGIPENVRYNSVLFGGFLGSMFSFLQFLSSPILGTISDFSGRKPVLILSAVGSLSSYFLWSKSETFAIFMLSRFLGGISKASVSVSTAIVADILPVKSRGQGMVVIGAAFSLGFIFGPIIGAYFAHINKLSSSLTLPVKPAYFAMALTFFQLIWTLVFLPETHLKKSTLSKSYFLDKASQYLSPNNLFFCAEKMQYSKNEHEKRISSVQRISLVCFSFLLIYSGLEFTLTFLTHLLFDYSSMQQGKLYFFTGILMVLIQGGFVRRLRVEKHAINVAFGIIATGISFLFIGLCALLKERIFLYIGLIFFAFGSSTVVTILTTMLSSAVPESEQGMALGTFRSLGALARALGPFLTSGMFWTFGAVPTYVIGGLAMIAPLYLLQRTKTV